MRQIELSNTALSDFFKQLALLMQAGISLGDGLLLLAEEEKDEEKEEDRGESVSGAKVVTTFDGTLDFQGYTLTHYYENGSGQQFIQNMDCIKK